MGYKRSRINDDGVCIHLFWQSKEVKKKMSLNISSYKILIYNKYNVHGKTIVMFFFFFGPSSR